MLPFPVPPYDGQVIVMSKANSGGGKGGGESEWRRPLEKRGGSPALGAIVSCDHEAWFRTVATTWHRAAHDREVAVPDDQFHDDGTPTVVLTVAPLLTWSMCCEPMYVSPAFVGADAGAPPEPVGAPPGGVTAEAFVVMDSTTVVAAITMHARRETNRLRACRRSLAAMSWRARSWICSFVRFCVGSRKDVTASATVRAASGCRP